MKLIYIFYYPQKLHQKFLKFQEHNKDKQKSILRLLKNQNLKKNQPRIQKLKIIEKPIRDKIFEILRAIKIVPLLFFIKSPIHAANPVKITK